MGWLSIAQNQYDHALKSGISEGERRRARRKARSAIKEARSLFPSARRFGALVLSGPDK
jgi:hypothetical protein